jgi:NAD(P)-dependent dehydrogenase (short-subunit alcohol dehydrogenase family)
MRGMPQSFTAEPRTSPLADTQAKRRRVLVTGAAGNIGSYFAGHAHRRYGLRLMVRGDEKREKVEKVRGFGELVEGDVTNLDDMKRVCAGIDTVLHLAANPSAHATWDELLPANIVGTYNTFVAAKAAKCRRVIYASSIHAVSGYAPDVQVKTTEPVNPGDLYGVTKCFGEALARYMAEQEGLSSICLRIGAFQPREAAAKFDSIEMADAWVSRRDLNQLIERSIDVVELRFAIFHGLSNNRFKRLDISDARQLVGYAPVDDLTEINPQMKKLRLREKVGGHNVKDDPEKSGIRKELKPTRATGRKASRTR